MRRVTTLAFGALLGATACVGSPRDPQTAGKEPILERLKQGCAGKKGADCRELGRRHHDGDGLQLNETEALRFYQLGCDAGDAAACHAAGQAFLLGAGVIRDVDRALPLLTKACDAGDANGCFKLGGLNAGGPFGPPVDEAKGFGFFVKACDLGLASGCYRAGSAAEFGRFGAKSDVDTATALYRVGCGVSATVRKPTGVSSIGQASACWRLGVLSQAQNLNAPRADGDDLLRMARDYFARQCDAGMQLECFSLATIYSTGEGAAVDLEQARALFQRACELQNPAACEEAERLRQGSVR